MSPALISPAVIAAWRPWNAPFEGEVDYLYLDTEGYPTTAMGNMVATREAALPLGWVMPDGRLATREEIADAYYAVARHRRMIGDVAADFAPLTTIRLPESARIALIRTALAADAAALARRFEPFGDWPADAQLGALSMAWAMGAGFCHGYPKWSAAADREDWNGCAAECAMADKGGDAIRWRNQGTAQAFKLAALALNRGCLHSRVPPLPPLPPPWRAA